MKKILIIEDDYSIANLIKDYLEASDMEVTIAKDGLLGESLAMKQSFDLILLDIMLPNGKDGFSVCANLRKHMNIPILFISAKREEIDKIKGLGLGANDYITKPFHPHELVARIKSQIANYERLLKPQQQNILSFEGLEIHLDSHEVFVGGKPVTFPNREYELLVFLAKHPNILFTKEQLFEAIWGLHAIGEINTVTVHINRIRDKLSTCPNVPNYIETIWGSGYRFKKK